MRLVAIANPAGPRWQHFERELAAFAHETGERWDVEVVPWRDVIPRDGSLDGLAAFDRPAAVRLESPGRDFDVARQLLQAGERADANPRPPDWSTREYRKGELLQPALLDRGLRRVLAGLDASFAARPHLRPLARPSHVAEMFDKNVTARRLDAAGLPCPPWFTPPRDSTPADLLSACAARGFPTAYVKLAAGSSAAGIAVVSTSERPPSALTSVLRDGNTFFSSRRLQRVTGADLDATLAFLAAQGATVQQGIPKLEIDGQNSDLRVVVIAGRPEFAIVRLSPGPLTNLHFGGRRGDLRHYRAAIPPRLWLDAMDHCAAAARLYDSLTVGVDLAFERRTLRHHILELNAFGDFFPNWTDDRARTVHGAVIRAIRGPWGRLVPGRGRAAAPPDFC